MYTGFTNHKHKYKISKRCEANVRVIKNSNLNFVTLKYNML